MPAIAFYILQRAIIRDQGPEGLLAKALGADLKGKISPVLYIIAIVFAFFVPMIAEAIYVGVALMWLIPDRRVERMLDQRQSD